MIYICSPYSHPNPEIRQWRYECACKAAAWLINRGHAVFSPIAHSHPIAMCGVDPMDSATWMLIDMRLLTVCEDIYVLTLPGWDESKGIAMEICGRNWLPFSPAQAGIDIKTMPKE